MFWKMKMKIHILMLLLQLIFTVLPKVQTTSNKIKKIFLFGNRIQYYSFFTGLSYLLESFVSKYENHFDERRNVDEVTAN